MGPNGPRLYCSANLGWKDKGRSDDSPRLRCMRFCFLESCARIQAVVEVYKDVVQNPEVCYISCVDYYNGIFPFGYVLSERAVAAIRETDLLKARPNNHRRKSYMTHLRLETPSEHILRAIPWAKGVVFVGVEKGSSDWNRIKHAMVRGTLEDVGLADNLPTIRLNHW